MGSLIDVMAAHIIKINLPFVLVTLSLLSTTGVLTQSTVKPKNANLPVNSTQDQSQSQFIYVDPLLILDIYWSNC